MLYIFFISICYLLLQLINGVVLYYNTTNNISVISSINNITHNNLFVFLPGTSSECSNYSELFNNIHFDINILCINYISGIKQSEEYYKNHSFLDKSNSLEKLLLNALVQIYFIYGINYLNYGIEITPNWGKLHIAGHSQGGVLVTGWAKKYTVSRLILFSSPGCQFGKILSWINFPFNTNIKNIYGIESLQDSILPWTHGNSDFNCEKQYGVQYYLKSLNITNNSQIQKIDPFIYYTIYSRSQIILLDTPLIDGDSAHLITCFNMNILRNISNNLKKNINREKIWKYIIL